MAFFAHYPIFIPFVSVLSAEVLKLLVSAISQKKLTLKDFARSGGMPSAHAALVSSLGATIFFLRGIGSTEFAVAAVFSVVVLYDSIKLRWEAGKHAKILNYLLGEKKLEERLGHTFLEMLSGIFLGVAVTFLLVAM